MLDDTLLLDCGDARFLNYKPKAIVITHLHPDHAFFVWSGQHADIDVPMYAPEQYKTVAITRIMSSMRICGYQVTPIPTSHSLKVASCAYLIEQKGKKILYTGDMIWIEKKYHPLLHDLDLVITEASYMRKGGLVRRDPKTGQIYGHTGVPNLIALFKSYTQMIVFVHFGSWFYHNIKAARRKFAHLAKENDVDIIVGYDGLEIEV